MCVFLEACLCGGVYVGLETYGCPVAECNERQTTASHSEPHVALDPKSNLQTGQILFIAAFAESFNMAGDFFRHLSTKV